MIVSIPEPADIAAIVKLVNSDPTHLVPRHEREVAKKLHFWRIVKVDGRIVACGCFDVYSRRIAEIRSLIVDPAFRGLGYAQHILESLISLTRAKQQVFVVTSVPDFFEKNDFSSCMGEKYIMFYKKTSL